MLNRRKQRTQGGESLISLTQCLSILSIAFIAGACTRIPDDPYVATRNTPAKSPSGKYKLHVKSGSEVNGSRYQAFEIEDLQTSPPQVAFKPTDRFMARHATVFLWDEADRVWVHSGDVGTHFWVRNTNGNWEKHIYAHENVSAPNFLKRLRPQIFQK